MKNPFSCSQVTCVTCDELFPNLFPLGNFQICTSIVMKKAGHESVPSNPTEKWKATFLASLNHFLSDYAQKNEDAGNLQEKVSPYGCSTCGKLFPYLYPFGDFQICTSMVMKKAGHSNQTGECTEIFLASLNNFQSDYALDAVWKDLTHFHSLTSFDMTVFLFLLW